MKSLLALAGLFFVQCVCALEIHIDAGYDEQTKIAIVPFGSADDSDDISDIVSFDLARSGQFDPLASENMLSYPTQPDEVFFRDWRILGTEYLVIGRVHREASGDLGVRYYLYDVFNERQLASREVRGGPDALRDLAHRVADDVFEATTGIRGAFSTKILYVLAQNLGTSYVRFKLEVADSDGERTRTLFESSEPMLSASWSPDARRVAYVSFETGRSAIYVQDLEGGARERIAEYPGINSAPVFSPDGGRLAMVLSRDGNPEIYVMDLATRKLRRITRYPSAIDTEPSWTTDGNSLIFTSDRGGRPQIYQVDLNTLLVERLTFQGDSIVIWLDNDRHLKGESLGIHLGPRHKKRF